MKLGRRQWQGNMFMLIRAFATTNHTLISKKPKTIYR